MAINTGDTYIHNHTYVNSLTKREQFAMAAMNGLNANPSSWQMTATQIAVCAVECADALIAELNKEVKE